MIWLSLVLRARDYMSDVYSQTGTKGTYGAATARAREQRKDSDEQTEMGAQARESRIAELRRQYLAGTYQVDAHELSAALMKRCLAKDG